MTDLIKDITIVLASLMALVTAIVAYKTKIIEYKSQVAKSQAEKANPADMINSSQAMNQGGGKKWWGVWELFMSIMSVVVYCGGLGFLMFQHHGSSSSAVLSQKDFYFGLMVVTLILVYQFPQRKQP